MLLENAAKIQLLVEQTKEQLKQFHGECTQVLKRQKEELAQLHESQMKQLDDLD